MRAYDFIAAEYRRPLVIVGFEPLDVLQSILMLVRQINAGEAQVENVYTRAVGAEGNRKVRRLMDTTQRRWSQLALGVGGDAGRTELTLAPELRDLRGTAGEPATTACWPTGARRVVHECA